MVSILKFAFLQPFTEVYRRATISVGKRDGVWQDIPPVDPSQQSIATSIKDFSSLVRLYVGDHRVQWKSWLVIEYFRVFHVLSAEIV